MSRIHRISAELEEVSAAFRATAAPGLAVPPVTIEGGSGLVVVEQDGLRTMRRLDWGFPRLTREMRDRGEPSGRVGLVADLTNSMWEDLVTDPARRCLIALTHFANPDGAPGARTRTWFSLRGRPVAAWAGFYSGTREFGEVYAGMTTTANAAVAPTNDRMPVLLEPGEWDRWLHGSIRDVIGFQFREPVAADRMVVERTAEPWRGGAPPPPSAQMALL